MLNYQNPMFFYDNLWLLDEGTFIQNNKANKWRKKESIVKKVVKYSLLFLKG